jgi:hypothetical protein
MQAVQRKLYQPYVVMLAIFAILAATAFIADRPAEIFSGLVKILTSRSVLLTDYIFVGGLGAALLNSALLGSAGVAMLSLSGVKPNGSTIMALWLTAGFAFFGKNIFNILPITFGVFLYSRYKRESFINSSLMALLSGTLAPVVSDVAFSGRFWPMLSVFYGVLLGVIVGAFFPVIASAAARVHEGYCLYNTGFAGGLVAMFLVAAFASAGIPMPRELHWSKGYELPLAIMLYAIFAGLMALGLVKGAYAETKACYPQLLKLSGRLVTDFYVLFGKTAYFNMGLCGVLATTVTLLISGDLNGPTVGGIFTIVGFAAFGKHIRNIVPPMLGAIISAFLNTWDPNNPANTVAILFATGLAPIAGQFGWFWGAIAGAVHVSVVIHVSELGGGLNLYNNGFAGGFVALLLVPVITALKKDVDK